MGAVYGLEFVSTLKPDSNGSPMNDGARAADAVQGRIAQQIPAFAAIGLIGYFVDAGITFVGAKYGGLSPELARPPGFIVATIVNFVLNRSITFRHSRAPLSRAFLRYCGVASLGLAVNYAVYSACVVLAPEPGDRRHASNPPAICRRWERRCNGFDLCRFSVLRLSAVGIADCLAQSLPKRAMIASKRCGSSARCPFRPMTATSTAIRPIFSR